MLKSDILDFHYHDTEYHLTLFQMNTGFCIQKFGQQIRLIKLDEKAVPNTLYPVAIHFRETDVKSDFNKTLEQFAYLRQLDKFEFTATPLNTSRLTFSGNLEKKDALYEIEHHPIN